MLQPSGWHSSVRKDAAQPASWRSFPQRVSVRHLASASLLGATTRKPLVFLAHRSVGRQRRQPNPSHRPCACPYDLASVLMTVRPISNSLRRAPPPVSINVRRKPPLIARRGVHHCAPLQVAPARPAVPGAPGARRPASRPMRQRRPAWAFRPWSSAAPSFAGVPSAAPAHAPTSQSRLGNPTSDVVKWVPTLR